MKIENKQSYKKSLIKNCLINLGVFAFLLISGNGIWLTILINFIIFIIFVFDSYTISLSIEYKTIKVVYWKFLKKYSKIFDLEKVNGIIEKNVNRGSVYYTLSFIISGVKVHQLDSRHGISVEQFNEFLSELNRLKNYEKIQ